jgi:hydrogenase maturation protein HypF
VGGAPAAGGGAGRVRHRLRLSGEAHPAAQGTLTRAVDQTDVAATDLVRVELRIEGIVQGVGFRPFVHALATRLGLAGSVANDAHGVTVAIEGGSDRLARFLDALEREAPPLARVERVTRRSVPVRGDTAFAIAPSGASGGRTALVAPDAATCEDCLRELFDPGDRRHRYPFINCTNCGPRFTILRRVPYDRAATTMAAFAMCADCRREYEDPANRRFHAEPIACPACGPRLALLDARGARLADDPVEGAAALIRAGRIVAVKGLGGYHLAADAASATAVAALRRRKHREEKPFAVMAPDLAAVRRLVAPSPDAERLLTSPRRPIVLLPRRPDAPVAPATAPGNRHLGVMLPYTPVHHLLARALAAPVVLTSGNLSDEPIAYRDDDALARLGGIADAFLTHDRPIHVRTDDSVVRTFRGTPLPIRRSRGYAPQPVTLPRALARPVLACGAELKNTVCVARGRHALPSHHIGDLEDDQAFRSFTEAIDHLQRLLDVRPAAIAHDLHPEYLSTKWAREQEGVPLVGVQHHHAHIAACLADNGEAGPVIGVALDGLGYGPDGTLWGGEFLIADLDGFERAGHLAPVPMPGGTAAIREPWRMAAVYLAEAFAGAVPPLDVVRRHEARWAAVLEVARVPAHAPLTSSAGRLFDAVAALLGVRDRITYEGQAAIELEQLVDPAETGAYAAALVGAPPGDATAGVPGRSGVVSPREAGSTGGDVGPPAGETGARGAGAVAVGPWFVLRGADLVRAAAEDLGRGASPGVIAARFHRGMAEAIVRGCRAAGERSGLSTVALSGGVFQNAVLLAQAVDRLQAGGFRVLWHRQVPPNDGGISLGQAVIAGGRAAA